ncbi:hypothetical protein N7467_001590 [Penicillium canescens]|nr:hypothetical protein N7467_001590 [Penicillium canescens]
MRPKDSTKDGMFELRKQAHNLNSAGFESYVLAQAQRVSWYQIRDHSKVLGLFGSQSSGAL